MEARLDAMMNRSKIVGHGVRGDDAGDEDDTGGGVIATLRAPAEVLELVRGDAEQLHTSIESTSRIAETLSARIRVLDTSRVRVMQSITRVNAILDRGACVDGAKSSLDSIKAAETRAEGEAAAKSKLGTMRILLEACGHVLKYRKLNDEYGELGEEDGPVSGEQRATMDAARKELESRVRSGFTAAAANVASANKGDTPVDAAASATTAGYARMFPMLGLADEGLTLFVKYLRGIINNNAVARMTALTEELAERERFGESIRSGGGANFVTVLGQLFGDVADAIDSNLSMLRNEFGADAIATTINELQKEVDNRGSQLVSRFLEARDVMRLMRESSTQTDARHPGNTAVGGVGGAAGHDSGMDTLRRVESVLEELTLLCRQSEEYSLYVMQRLRDAHDGAPLSPEAMNAIRMSPYQRRVQELASCYASLEERSMVDSVRRAIAIDEHQTDVGALISSMVDDSFFLLQKSATRALNTQSIQCVCATFNHVGNILANEFRKALELKIRGASSGLLSFNPLDNPRAQGLGAATAKDSQDDTENANLAAERAGAINDAEVSGEYVGKLRKNLEEAAVALFSASSDRERIKSCLGDLSETATAFRQIALSSLHSVSNGIFSRVRPALESLAASSYVLSEAEYADNEMKDPWLQRLISSIVTIVQWLQPLLVPSAFENLVQIIVDSVVSRLEAAVLTKRFNQLGGLQLDREVRALVSSFSVMTSKSLRDRFARLTQVATVVNLESVSEILDYWGENSGSMTWRLTPAEVRKILSLRVDFRAEDIAAIEL